MSANDPFGTPTDPAKSGDFDFVIDVKDQGLLPPGNYQVRCADVQPSTSKEGNPMLVWDFIVVGKETTIRSWTSLQANAKWKIIEYVKALGLIIEGDELKFNRRDVIGKLAYAVLEHREYQGRKNLNIKQMLNPEDVPEEQREDDPFAA